MRRLAIAVAVIALGSLAYLSVIRQRARDRLSIHEQEAALGSGDSQSNRLRVLSGPGDPARGARDALVTLVEFCDFRSPECKRVARTLFEAVLAYPGEVRVVLKPLPRPDDAESLLAAEAALAANEQGKFWEMHDLLFSDPGPMDRAGLEDKTQRLGFDMERFRARLESPELRAKLDELAAYGEKLGVASVPALFLNGLRVDDPALAFVELKPRIDVELDRVRTLMKEKGLSAAEVYSAIMREARPSPLRSLARPPAARVVSP